LAQVSQASKTGLLREVLIVDSSDESNPKLFSRFECLNMEYIIVPSVLSLTQKRNLAIARTSKLSSIIVFLDDDVQITLGMFESIIETFNYNSGIVGVGGVDLLMFGDEFKFSELDLELQGRILSDGRNMPFCRSAETAKVDWISGCMMAFRREITEIVKFDERRIFDGEDVAFCLLASSFGTLVVNPKIHYFHKPFSAVSKSGNHRILDHFRHRAYLLIDHPSRFSFSRVGSRILWTAFRSILKGLKELNLDYLSSGIKHLFAFPYFALFYGKIYLGLKREKDGIV
jgi:GT2 family glycosyltransferase